MSSLRSQMRYMNPYDLHKALINECVLRKPGDTKLIQRNTCKDRTDHDVLRENHQFLWNESTPESWEAQFAKKYYDKLFKEYCIGDLSLYKENKIALRWRIEQEVVVGKGQFVCGNKKCNEKNTLRTWEVNFAYREQGEKKNALVKIRLCPDCSRKLNFHNKKKEIKRLDAKNRVKKKAKESYYIVQPVANESCSSKEDSVSRNEISPWETQKTAAEVTKSRDEEMEDYLKDLLL